MPCTLRSLVRLSLAAAAGGLLLAQAACFPWPVRSRAFYLYPSAGQDAEKYARSAGGNEYMFERCRGTFYHPVLNGHCFYVTVRSDLVTQGRELRFPGDGVSATLMPVELSQKRPTTPASGLIRFRQVGPQRIVADLEVSGRTHEGKAYALRDRIGFQATVPGSEPFFHF